MDVSYVSPGFTKVFFVRNSSAQRSLGIPTTTELDGALGWEHCHPDLADPFHADTSREAVFAERLTSAPATISASDAKLMKIMFWFGVLTVLVQKCQLVRESFCALATDSNLVTLKVGCLWEALHPAVLVMPQKTTGDPYSSRHTWPGSYGDGAAQSSPQAEEHRDTGSSRARLCWQHCFFFPLFYYFSSFL